MACTLAESPSAPLHRKLRQLRCLRCRFDCYRVERTSSRAGVTPAEVQRLSRRTFSPTILIEIPPTPQLSFTCLFHMLLCKRSGNKLSHSWLSAQKPGLGGTAEAVPFHQSRSTQTLRHSLNNRIPGRRGNDPREFPFRRFQQFAEFWFSAFASAGEKQHLQIQEFSGREVVARLNHAIYHQQLSAGIYALAAGF